MTPKEIAAEIAAEAVRVREGIAFLETDSVRFLHNNVDVTADWIERQKSIADHLEQLAEAYGNKDA